MAVDVWDGVVEEAAPPCLDSSHGRAFLEAYLVLSGGMSMR